MEKILRVVTKSVEAAKAAVANVAKEALKVLATRLLLISLIIIAIKLDVATPELLKAIMEHFTMI